MKLATNIVSVALATTALCGVGAGTASAATAGGSHGASAAARTTASTTESTVTVVAYQASLNTFDSVSLPSFVCPSDQPWLVNATLSPGRIVPAGVKVDEPGGIGVTIPHAFAGPQDLASGWRSGSATNWGTRNTVTVSAVCTNLSAAAYPA